MADNFSSLNCFLILVLSIPRFLHGAQGSSSTSIYGKVCLGSDYGIGHGHSGQPLDRYEMYRKKYTNCTYVDGNLEIVFLDGIHTYNMSFLQNIQEVTGYVLIISNYADYIPLTSLRVIRGRTLYYDQTWKSKGTPGTTAGTIGNMEPVHSGYGLYVAHNFLPGSTTVGLKELRFSSLHEIMNGDVYFYNNNLLCFENTINWGDILTGENAQVIHHRVLKEASRICFFCCSHSLLIAVDGNSCIAGEHCHENCTNDKDINCWGEGPEMCQTLTRLSCSPQCDGRCYGALPNQCCHPECAGGCDGPTRYDCWVCKNFINDKRCEPFCPHEFIYDPRTYRKIPNPNAKYSYGSICVKECPAHLIADRGSCVGDCGAGRIAGPDRKCVECDGPCPKTCAGTLPNEWINAHNIRNYTGCTIIQGGLRILHNSFAGDDFRPDSGIQVEDLSVFETVQEITDFLLIQANVKGLHNLSFFRNLRAIHGRVTDSNGASLHIYGTSLTSLDLRSLKEINNGNILIASNPHLCFVNSINWTSMLGGQASGGLVCSSECTRAGCFGYGDDQCLECANYRFENRCLSSCNGHGLYTASGTRECRRCHRECLEGCSSSGADDCNACRHVHDGPYCVEECPQSKYPNETNGCEACHENCANGCSGPQNTVGPDACNSCSLVRLDAGGNLLHCLPPDDDCGPGYYKGIITSWILKKTPGLGKVACMPCEEECLTCSGPGLSFCSTCRHLREEGRCVSNCSMNYFSDNDGTKECKPCDPQCIHCTGPTNADCIACKNYKIYAVPVDYDGQHYSDITTIATTPQFNCTNKCPESAPHKSTENSNGIGDTICVLNSPSASIKRQIGVTIGVIASCVVLLGLVVLPVVYMRRQWARAEENKLRLTARMSGLDDSEPLTPSDAKPDMSSLRLIKESELRRGNIIGSGAFGTVYKGVWVPAGENVKIPVAIKVLQEGTSASQNKELLEEARIMTSVVHPCCIRIIAVCMTVQMMLITQLMPLGCLLDYVRKNRANICSKVMLNWSTQIARGMAYLEERGIVHRDLAARNVLVTDNQCKITDFGLAKLLDYNEDEFHAGAGKMPIKWLALESIQHRVFTHKSDVWSFGVTMWELFTYGQRPYENIPARDISDLLEKGERLSQPFICTIDVYMIMIKCWMLDALSRPSFKELADEFAKMARDPGRYLVIPGDKLMRLPRHSYDRVDLVRNMSIPVDGPEEVVTAEEYFHVPGNPPASGPNSTDGNNSTQYHVNGGLDVENSVTDDDSHSRGSSSRGRRTRCRPDPIIDTRFYAERDPQFFLPTQPQWLRTTQNEFIPQSSSSWNRVSQSEQCSNGLQHEHFPMTNLVKSDCLNNNELDGGLRMKGCGDFCSSVGKIDELSGCKCGSSVPFNLLAKDSVTNNGMNIVNEALKNDLDIVLTCKDENSKMQSSKECNFRLPLDEDDYLLPNMSKSPIYLDLLPDLTLESADYSALNGEKENKSNGVFTKQVTQPISSSVAVNPEYFDDLCVNFVPVGSGSRNKNITLFSMDRSETQPMRLRSQSTESSTSDTLDSFTEYDQLNRKKSTMMSSGRQTSPESTAESSM